MATQVGVGWRGVLQQQRSSSAEAGGAFGQMKTRDLLSGSLRKEIDIDLDLDLDVEPQTISLSLSGWEKRLDMKSGKVYFRNCYAKENAAASATDEVALHDLNFPPCPVGVDSALMKESSPKFCELEWLCRVTGRDRTEDAAVMPLEELNFMGKAGSINDDIADTNPFSSVELEGNEPKLNLKLSNHEGASEWQSVCTLDKVKMALKRAEKNNGKRKKSVSASIELGQSSSWEKTRSMDRSPSLSSSSCSSLGLSLLNSEGEGEGERSSSGETALQAAGCPRCLVYVLLAKANPKCPRCGYLIFLNRDLPSFKRPRMHTHTDREEAHSHGPSTVKSAPSLPFDLNSVV